MKKTLTIFIIAIALAFTFVGCKKESGDLTKIKVGVSPVPHAEIVEALKDEFKAQGLDVEVVTFTDYVQPNIALAEGDLDLNYFQHEPYLKEFCASRNLDLANIGAIHLEPMGFYAKNYKSVDEFKDGDEIVIPNDPSNGARALRLLEDAGLIKLSDYNSETITEKDIVENPKNLKITAVDAATVAKAYEDVAGGVINSNYALGVGLNPKTDPIFVETTEGNPNANIIAARSADKDNEAYKKFVQVLKSDKAKEFINEKYDGSVIPVE